MPGETTLIRQSRDDRSLDLRVRRVAGGLTLAMHPRGPLGIPQANVDAALAAFRLAGFRVALHLPAIGVLSVHPTVLAAPEARVLMGPFGAPAPHGGVGPRFGPALVDDVSGAALHYDGAVVARFTSAPTPAEWGAIGAQVPFGRERDLLYASYAYVLRPADPSLEAGVRLSDACYALPTATHAYPVLSQMSRDHAVLPRAPQGEPSPEEWHWGSPGYAARNFPGRVGINAPRAWASGNLGENLRVAVIERECAADVDHVQLAGRVHAARDVTLVPAPTGDNLRKPTAMDGKHATMVAGLACAGGIPRDGAAGVTWSASGSAPRAQLVAILAEDGLGSLAEADALYQAKELGADVINCSWGLDSEDRWHTLRPHVSWAIEHVTREGRSAPGKRVKYGCTVIFSAGNGARYGQTTAMSGYCRHPDVIVVGACMPDGTANDYSNPGREVLCVVPMGYSANGVDVFVRTLDITGPLGGNPAPSPEGDYADSIGKTSAAAPAVAGVVLLMLEKCPTLTPGEIRDILWQSSTPLGGRAPVGAHHYNFGAGRVNAEAAVKLASRYR